MSKRCADFNADAMPRRRPDHLRLFVAACPPVEIARELRRLVPAPIVPLVRKTALGQIHLTLLFLGKVATRDLGSVVESVDRSCAGQRAFELAFEKLIALPQQGAKRTLVATTSAPAALLEIRSRLVRRLSRRSRERPNDRFLPHFTVARFQQPQEFEVEQALALARVSIGEIRLMRSDLTQEGATHRLVHACQLEQA